MLIKLHVSVEQESTHFTTERVSEQDELVIGRDVDVDLQIPYTRVSRRHCAIKKRGPQYFVLDLGSSHGTMLNSRRLPANEAVPLRDGDLLDLAGAEIRVSIFEESGEDTARRLVDFIGSPHSLDPYVVVLSGRHKDQSFSLQGATVELLLGRSDECNIVIDDNAASRRHALIKKDVTRGIVFQCLGAKNETLINGEKVEREGSRVLVDRDLLQFGGVRMMFVNPGADIDKAVNDVLASVEGPKTPAPSPPTPVDPSVDRPSDEPVDPPKSNTQPKLKLPTIPGMATLDITEPAPKPSRMRDLGLSFAAGVVVGVGATLLALML